jgi:CBS domain-containing protein
VAIRDIASLPPEQRGFVTVGQVMGGQPRLKTVSADSTVLDAFDLLDDDNLEQLLVMDSNRYVGLLTRADVARQLQLREELDA